MTKEEWRDIPGYEKMYKISSTGKVVSYPKTWRSGRWVNRSSPEKEMSASVDKKGYFVIGLRKDNKGRMWKVHRLVAIAFIPNPENKSQVNHKDGDKQNNVVSNLEWATGHENMQHARKNGLIIGQSGEDHPRSKLKEEDVVYIRNSPLSDRQLSKQLNVSRGAIQGARTGRTWSSIPNANNQFIESQNK